MSFKSGITQSAIASIPPHHYGHSCNAIVDGTSATAGDGMLAASYANSGSAMTTGTSGRSLRVYDVSGCAGLFNNGDKMVFSATYTVTPKQTITG